MTGLLISISGIYFEKRDPMPKNMVIQNRP
jgi:hypothetical protein